MPRAGLSRAVVVAEAAAAADELGLDRLTLATLAARLGVKQPSLYNHLDGLDGLYRELAVLAVTELNARLSAAAVGRSGRDALLGMAHAMRAFAHERPGLYLASTRAPAPGDAEHERVATEGVSIVFAVLGGYGLTGEDAVDATRSLRAALHGWVTLEAGGGFGMPRDVDRSFAVMLDRLDAGFRGLSTGSA